MKLIQIKEFNKETVTNEIAYQIFAIAGNWKNYLKQEYIDKGFECEERWYGSSTDGRSSSYNNNWNTPNYTEKGYVRTFQGLTLTPIKSTYHRFHLNKDGGITCYNVHEAGSLKSWNITTGEEFYEKFIMNLEYPANQIKLIQLYLDLGFYTIEI